MIGRLALLGILDVLRRPWSLTATVAGVAVTVFLGGLFALAATAVDGAFANGRGQAQFQIYWKVGADAGLTARQMDWMRALPGVVEARAFTPEQALAVMRQSLGKGADLTFPAAGQNPLPATMLLAFRLPPGNEAFAREMYGRLAAVEGVGEVRFNPLAVDVAQSVGFVGRRIALPLAAILALLVALVVGHTVRLSLLRRREEMEILRLVGATEGYICGPFVSGSAFVGLLGGVAAIGLLKFVQAAVAEALNVPPLWLTLPFLSGGLVTLFILGTTATAALAGYVAVVESRS